MKNTSSTIPNCSSCMLCTLQDINGNILCRVNGITSYNYYCNRYKPKKIISKPSKLMHIFLTCSRCKHFDSHKSAQPGTGVCQFYKLRPFIGDKRKACSNFMEKTAYSGPSVYEYEYNTSQYGKSL